MGCCAESRPWPARRRTCRQSARSETSPAQSRSPEYILGPLRAELTGQVDRATWPRSRGLVDGPGTDQPEDGGDVDDRRRRHGVPAACATAKVAVRSTSMVRRNSSIGTSSPGHHVAESRGVDHNQASSATAASMRRGRVGAAPTSHPPRRPRRRQATSRGTVACGVPPAAARRRCGSHEQKCAPMPLDAGDGRDHAAQIGAEGHERASESNRSRRPARGRVAQAGRMPPSTGRASRK